MMIHPEIQAALVRERTRTFLADAEAARQSRSLGRPLPRPSGGRPVRLRDGSAVLIRPVRPEDAGLLEDGFAGLRYFTGVDHRDHEALGALDHVRGGGVGIARYVRDREDPYAAEIAVTDARFFQAQKLALHRRFELAEIDGDRLDVPAE